MVGEQNSVSIKTWYKMNKRKKWIENWIKLSHHDLFLDYSFNIFCHILKTITLLLKNEFYWTTLKSYFSLECWFSQWFHSKVFKVQEQERSTRNSRDYLVHQKDWVEFAYLEFVLNEAIITFSKQSAKSSLKWLAYGDRERFLNIFSVWELGAILVSLNKRNPRSHYCCDESWMHVYGALVLVSFLIRGYSRKFTLVSKGYICRILTSA